MGFSAGRGGLIYERGERKRKEKGKKRKRKEKEKRKKIERKEKEKKRILSRGPAMIKMIIDILKSNREGRSQQNMSDFSCFFIGGEKEGRREEGGRKEEGRRKEGGRKEEGKRKERGRRGGGEEGMETNVGESS